MKTDLTRFFLGLFICSVCLHACKSKRIEIKDLFISVPKTKGWVRDTSLPSLQPGEGGVALRLITSQTFALAPRIDIIVEDAKNGTPLLKHFVQKSEKALNTVQSQNGLEVTTIESQPVFLGDVKAHRLRHEYSLKTSKQGDAVSITQISTLFVVRKRGITITALGRTELLLPLISSIDDFMKGIVVMDGAKSTQIEPQAKEDKTIQVPNNVEIIDLGKIGKGN